MMQSDDMQLIGLTKKEDSIPRLIIICKPAVSIHDKGLKVPRHRISVNLQSSIELLLTKQL